MKVSPHTIAVLALSIFLCQSASAQQFPSSPSQPSLLDQLRRDPAMPPAGASGTPYLPPIVPSASPSTVPSAVPVVPSPSATPYPSYSPPVQPSSSYPAGAVPPQYSSSSPPAIVTPKLNTGLPLTIPVDKPPPIEIAPAQNAPKTAIIPPAKRVPTKPTKFDLTSKLLLFKDLRLVFPITQGVDTRWQKLGDYQFVADMEFNNATGYSYKWHMTHPARGNGIRATEMNDVKESKRVSLFYPEHQTCTLVGYTNIVRVSDSIFSLLKRGESTSFELDGPETTYVYNRPQHALPHMLKPVGTESADMFINDHLVSVRTIHAVSDNNWHYWILDNAKFPLMVRGHGPFMWNLVQLRHPKLENLLKGNDIDADSEARRIIKSLEDTGEATTRAILFDFDKSHIRTVSMPILSKLATYLKLHPELRLGVEGHTDIIGGMDYNMKLSNRRANSVKNYLVSPGGIAGSRLKPTGFGYTKPVADNSTAMGRQLNRRVVFRKL